MQHLDKEISYRLQIQHQVKDEAKPEHPLTEDILDRYEDLIHAQCTLRQIIEQGLPFQWPFRRSAPQQKETSPPPPPFDWLEKQTPKTAEKALEVVDKAISQVHKLYLWNFNKVQIEWFSEKEALRTKRSFVNKFRAAPTRKRRVFPGFFYLIVLPFLVGFLTIPFLSSDKYRAGISKTLVPPPTSEKYWLNDEEMQLLDEWQNVAKSSQNSYEDAFAVVNHEMLKQIGMKLINQGKLWQKLDSFTEANQRFVWAGQIGTVLKRVFDDEELIIQVVNLRHPSPEKASIVDKP
ncbi:MAG: hypothetical protein ACE5JB_04470 [bacterium]